MPGIPLHEAPALGELDTLGTTAAERWTAWLAAHRPAVLDAEVRSFVVK